MGCDRRWDWQGYVQVTRGQQCCNPTVKPDQSSEQQPSNDELQVLTESPLSCALQLALSIRVVPPISRFVVTVTRVKFFHFPPTSLSTFSPPFERSA